MSEQPAVGVAGMLGQAAHALSRFAEAPRVANLQAMSRVAMPSVASASSRMVRNLTCFTQPASPDLTLFWQHLQDDKLRPGTAQKASG